MLVRYEETHVSSRAPEHLGHLIALHLNHWVVHCNFGNERANTAPAWLCQRFAHSPPTLPQHYSYIRDPKQRAKDREKRGSIEAEVKEEPQMESSNGSIASLQYQNLEWKVQTVSASLCDTFGIFFDFRCVVCDWNERYVDFRQQRALVGQNSSYYGPEKRLLRRNADKW
jgi:hypothetical protein